MIDDTMVIQGSCWLMKRSWWDNVIKRLEDENYGTFAQEPIEIVMKTFIAGGRTMVNKNTWYAHPHRSFGRTTHISGAEIRKGNEYALNRWKGDLPGFNQYFGI
ncbi:MAG: hypothetical protein NTW60_02790 [Candidatus Wolfebacteria bacterium]|nr:hypothetical protein [Candidatus Wolfebacteria bacterium]